MIYLTTSICQLYLMNIYLIVTKLFYCDLWCSRTVVLNLSGGNEFYKLHLCIHRIRCNWKSKMWFLESTGIYFMNAQNKSCLPPSHADPTKLIHH